MPGLRPLPPPRSPPSPPSPPSDVHPRCLPGSSPSILLLPPNINALRHYQRQRHRERPLLTPSYRYLCRLVPAWLVSRIAIVVERAPRTGGRDVGCPWLALVSCCAGYYVYHLLESIVCLGWPSWNILSYSNLLYTPVCQLCWVVDCS